MKRLSLLAAAAAFALGSGAAQAADPLKVGFIYVGPVGDFGWSYEHDQARQAVEECALASVREVGLAPTKAKNIRRLSELLIERHQGEIPNTFEELEALPGVGHKTAGVVLAQAFGIPAFPVDTHIHRLAARWGLSNGKNVDQTEKDLKAVFPKNAWNALHLQIIFFGREYCPARYHDLSQCPICSWAATKKRIKDEARMNKPKRSK